MSQRGGVPSADVVSDCNSPRTHPPLCARYCACVERLLRIPDRMAEMERQNGILLNKLYRIQTRSKGDETSLKDGSRALNPGEACRNRVRIRNRLNSTARKQELERIAVENVAILRRIQEVRMARVK